MNSLEEIKVGEYVRTTNKGIRQIAMIDNHKTVNKYLYYIGEDFEGKSYAYIKTTEILKHSFNLIDLIEVGDYVNGRKVKHIAMFEGFPDYPKLIFVDETHLIPDDTYENEDIKTILTKESYMANCYKVGGEKDEASND